MRNIITSMLTVAVVVAGLVPAARPASAAEKGSYGPWSVTTLSRDNGEWDIESFKLDRDIVAWTEIDETGSFRRLYANDGLATELLVQMPVSTWQSDLFYEAIDGNYDVADGAIVWIQHDGNDREVYMRKDGVTSRVSDNTYDDARPRVSEGRVAWTSYPGGGAYNLMVKDADGVTRLDGWHVLNYEFSGENLYWLNRLPTEDWFRVFVNDGAATRAVGKGDDRALADYFLTDDDGSAAWEYSTKKWSYDKRETFASKDGAQAVRVIQRDVPPTVTHLEDTRDGEVLINEHNLLTYKLDATHQLFHVSAGWNAAVTQEKTFTKARFFGKYGHVRHLVPETGSPLVVRHDDGTESWMGLERVIHDMFDADGDVIVAGRIDGDALLYSDKTLTQVPTDGIVTAVGVRNGTAAWIAENAPGEKTLEIASKGILVRDGSTARAVTGRLVKAFDSRAVYVAATNGKRYVFNSEGPFYSWFDDFDSLVTIDPAELASMPLGGAVIYRPGSRLVKTQHSPKVYTVAADGSLRWVTDGAVLASAYGSDWERRIDVIPDAFLTGYAFGGPISDLSAYKIALASRN